MAKRRHVDTDAVIALMRTYQNEARKCRRARAYLAGCVMIGSALDASLTALTRIYSHHVRKVGERPAQMRTLGPLVGLAGKMGWLSGRSLWAANRIVKSRNKVHADVFGRRGQLPRIRVAELDARLDDMSEVTDALYVRVAEPGLRRAMRREEVA